MRKCTTGNSQPSQPEVYQGGIEHHFHTNLDRTSEELSRTGLTNRTIDRYTVDRWITQMISCHAMVNCAVRAACTHNLGCCDGEWRER